MPWRTGLARWICVYFLLAGFLPAVAETAGKTDPRPGTDPPTAEPAPAPTPPISPGSVPAPQAATPSAPAFGPTAATTPKPASAPTPATTPPQASGSRPAIPPAQPSPPESTPPAHLSPKEPAIGEEELPEAKPVPAMQVVPLPYDQASFQYLGRELTRYHFGPNLQRPFLYPVAGPEGRSLTRMGHPRDPFGHSHHNSVWISHADVGGVNFWADRDKTPPGRILCQRIEQYEDGPQSAWLLAVHAWQDAQGKTILLERRRIEVQVVDPEHWWIFIDMELAPPAQQPVTIGQTPFGMIGVRMAKTIGVSDGGGRLLNSEGQRGEVAMFRKPARWVDYSGPILPLPPTGTSEPKSPASPSFPQADQPRLPAPASQPQMTAPAHPSQTTLRAEQPRPSSLVAPSVGRQLPAGAGKLPTGPARSGVPGSANSDPAGPPPLGATGPAHSDATRLANLGSAGANRSGPAGLANSDVAGPANFGVLGPANLTPAGPTRSGKLPPEWAKYCAGITLMDHPANPSHPTPFHVRADGWMGASLTLARPITIPPGQPLRLRYGLWIHPGVPNRAEIDAQWRQFAQTPLPTFPTRKTP